MKCSILPWKADGRDCLKLAKTIVIVIVLVLFAVIVLVLFAVIVLAQQRVYEIGQRLEGAKGCTGM